MVLSLRLRSWIVAIPTFPKSVPFKKYGTLNVTLKQNNRAKQSKTENTKKAPQLSKYNGDRVIARPKIFYSTNDGLERSPLPDVLASN